MTTEERARLKFRRGEVLTVEELRVLYDVDKCRYVAEAYFPDGFSAIEVTSKLNQLLGVGAFTPVMVYDRLRQFYGEPQLKDLEKDRSYFHHSQKDNPGAMTIKEHAQNKLSWGGELTTEELRSLDDVDKCRYVAEHHLGDSFSVFDVAVKLGHLLSDCIMTPSEIFYNLQLYYSYKASPETDTVVFYKNLDLTDYIGVSGSHTAPKQTPQTVVDHLLTILMEECGEVIQEASKAKRFGVDEVCKQKTVQGHGEPNKDRVHRELVDVFAIMEMLSDEGLFEPEIYRDQIDRKKQKVKEYMDYSRELGRLI